MMTAVPDMSQNVLMCVWPRRSAHVDTQGSAALIEGSVHPNYNPSRAAAASFLRNENPRRRGRPAENITGVFKRKRLHEMFKKRISRFVFSGLVAAGPAVPVFEGTPTYFTINQVMKRSKLSLL